MTARNGRPAPRRPYSKHGLTLLKRAVKELGSRAIDRRTSLGKALVRWRTDLVADLGGAEAISTQEEALVDLAVKTKLLLDSVDAWLLTQPTLINARKRALLPVVKERTQLADALARYVGQLGLKWRARPTPNLQDYIREHYGQGQEDEDGDRHGDQEPAQEAEDPEAPNPPGSPHGEVAPPSEIARPGGAQEPPEAEER